MSHPKSSKTHSRGFWTQLPPELKTEFWDLPPEQRLALGPKIAQIAHSLGLTSDPEAALALVSEDGKFVACQARNLHKTVCKLRLFYNQFADVLRENKLNRQLYGCGSFTRYMSHADSRLETPASSFIAAADSGRGYRLYADELHKGVEDEPGVDDDFISKNLTKLALYGAVRARVGDKLALKAFKELSYASFRRYRDRDDYWVTKTAATELKKHKAFLEEKATKKTRGIKIQSLEEFPGRNPAEREIRRIISRNGLAFVAAASSPEILKRVRDRLLSYRGEIDNANYEKCRANPPSVTLAHILEDDAIDAKTALDAEDRIRGAVADMAASRYTLSILVTRLCYEPFFTPQWHSRDNSFSNYARNNLGIGEELRDLLRVGRNLYKYPYFLGGQAGLATENVFLSLRYLDEAMRNHHGDVSLIRSRIRHLSVREFAAFAKDPHYDERGNTTALTRRQEEKAIEQLGHLSHAISEGKAVEVLELYDEEEGSQVQTWIAELDTTKIAALESVSQPLSIATEEYIVEEESIDSARSDETQVESDDELSRADIQEMMAEEEASLIEQLLEEEAA